MAKEPTLQEQVEEFLKDPKAGFTEALVNKIIDKREQQRQAEADRVAKERLEEEKKKGFRLPWQD
jgi:ABC-type dipeptide/oligopeptide/nickel transport system ATPase component